MSQAFQLLCINLERSPERRADIAAQADALGLELEFVPAVDGRAMAPDDQELRRYDAAWRRWTWRSGLSAPEIACVLSHRRAVSRFLASDHRFAVVLEDDAVLAEDFERRLQPLLTADGRWTVVRLETRLNEENSPVVARLPDGAALVVRRKWTLGGTAILYNRKAAEAFIEGSERFFEAFDNLVGRPFVMRDVILELEPPAAWERKTGPSTLEGARTGDARRKGMRLGWRWAMSAYRIWARMRYLRLR